MLLMQHHQDGLERRLFVIGIPRYTIKPLIAEMVKWEENSGVEWTIKRLKSLKVDLIRRQSGLEPMTWIRKNRQHDISGVIGSLFRWSDLSDRNFSRAIQAFMAYSYYILPHLTEEQKKKFLSGINPDNPDNLSTSFKKMFRDSVSRTIRQRRITCSGSPLVVYQGSPGKKAPRFFGAKSTPQNLNILDDLQLFNTDSGLRLYRDFKRLYEPLLVGLGNRKDYLNWLSDNQNNDSSDYSVRGGEIHFLQEPGGKLRSIASPFRIHQEALKPLGKLVYDVVSLLPWDCTFDQSKAIPHIQSCLRQGCQIHSIDLSSATDHFPLSLQVEALKGFLHEDDWDHIDLFIKISRGTWKSQIGDLKWTKGQPLGLYPSFGCFTLTHGLLLNYLSDCDYHNQFFVVGDDVVILEDELYNKYISVLDRMSCPWSPDKSISSSSLCEFAGRIVTSNWVIPQLKWRKMSDDNFLDICKLLGKQSRCLLTSRQKRVFDSVAHLCEPIGLNFSLVGDNLTKMVERTLDFYRPEEKVLRSLMGLRKRINNLLYTSSEDFNSQELESISATFDEKVKSALTQTVFSRWSTSCSIGVDAFESLPEALEIMPRLPLKDWDPKRVTTLNRYERLINT